MSKEFTVEENLEYLKKQMKYAGFGDRMNEKLDSAIATALLEGKDKITLDPDVTFHKTPLSTKEDYSTYNKLEATPNLTRREGTGLFNFNNYQAVLTKPDGSTEQQFVSTEYGKSYTVKEIANALDGGPVYKSWKNIKNEMYEGWKWLNMEQLKDNGNHKEHIKHSGYSFNMEKELDKQNIRFFNDEHRTDVRESLERGNYVEVYINNAEGKTEQRFLRANPDKGELDVFVIAMEKDKRVLQNVKQDESQKQAEGKEATHPELKENGQVPVKDEKHGVSAEQPGPGKAQGKASENTEAKGKGEGQDKKKGQQQNQAGAGRRNRPRERAEAPARGKGRGK